MRIDPDKSGTNVIPVKISLSRASRHELKLGGGLAYEPLTDDIRVRGAYNIVDPWPLYNLTLEGQLAITFPRDAILVPDSISPSRRGTSAPPCRASICSPPGSAASSRPATTT